jgi:hypothetical protein
MKVEPTDIPLIQAALLKLEEVVKNDIAWAELTCSCVDTDCDDFKNLEKLKSSQRDINDLQYRLQFGLEL